MLDLHQVQALTGMFEIISLIIFSIVGLEFPFSFASLKTYSKAAGSSWAYSTLSIPQFWQYFSSVSAVNIEKTAASVKNKEAEDVTARDDLLKTTMSVVFFMDNMPVAAL